MLSHDQKGKIVDALSTKIKFFECPMCHSHSFTITDGYIIQNLQSNIKTMIIGGNMLPSIAIVCNNCGFMSQHNLGVLGLLKGNNTPTEERIQNVLARFKLSNYVDSCKGMTLHEFEKHTIAKIREFEDEIQSCTKEDAEALKKHEKELSQIRSFYGKALNYVKTKHAGLELKDGELELLDRLYNNISR